MESNNEDGQTDIVNSDEGEEPFQDAIDDDMAVTVECPEQGCKGGTNEDVWRYTGDAAIAAVMLGHHLRSHDPQTRQADPKKPRPPTLSPPKLESQCSESRFEEWKLEWASYKQTVDLPTGSEASYILDCLTEEVRRDVRATTDNVREMPEDDLIAAVKRHAVLQRAISARKMDLYGLRQEDGEPVQKFYARITHLARQCQLTVPCPADGCRYHSAPYVSYADEVVKQVILVGLADPEIKKDVLGTSGVNDKTLAETIGLIEDKEAAARSTAGSNSAGHATLYKKISANDSRLKGTGKCEKMPRGV